MYREESWLAKATNTLTQYIVVLLAFLTPLFLIPVPWSSPQQSKALLVAGLIVLALIAWLISNVSKRRVIFTLDPVFLAVLLLPIAYAVSAFAVGGGYSSFVSGEALQGTVAAMLILFGVSFVTAAAVEERHISITLIMALLISAAIVVFFQILRLFFPDQLNLLGALPGNTSALVGSWHDLGIFAGLTLILACGLLETSLAAKRMYAVLIQVLALACLLLLVVVNFTDVWYSIAAAALLFAVSRILYGIRNHHGVLSSIRSATLWVVLAIVAGIAGFGTTFIYSHLPTPMQISQTEVRPSWSGTLSVSQHIFEGGKGLVFGSGPNTFDRQWELFKPAEVNFTNFWNTEFQYGFGVVPTALITVGIVGILCWLLLALAILWSGYRSFSDDAGGRLRMILFIASAFLLFFHIVYVPGIGISILMFMLFGILAGLNASAWRAGEFSFAPQSLIAFVAVLLLSCATIGAGLLQSRAIASSLLTTRAASEYQKSGDLQKASQEVALAVQVDPQNDIAQRAAVQIGLLEFGKLAQSGATDASREQLQKTLSSTIAHGLAAVSIDNMSYQNWLALAGLYQSLAGVGIQGAYEQATSAWQHAASTTPSNPLPHIQLGQIAMAQGKNTEAVAYFSKAIALKPNLALPYYWRAQIEAGDGKYKEAVQDAASAAQLANQDPLSWYALGIILYMAADYQNAGASLEKAVQLQSDYSDALFALAIVYDKLGIHDGAVAAIQKVIQLNPNVPLAQQVYQNLQSNKPALDGLQGSTETTGQTSSQKQKP